MIKQLHPKGKVEASIPFERRIIEDRRQTYLKTNIFCYYRLQGNRVYNRRQSDPKKDYFVDRYNLPISYLVISIIIMSILDWAFTIYHLNNGAIELNPLMDLVLKNGNTFSFLFKFILTSLGITGLCIYKNFSFVRAIIFFIFLCYITLTIYHLVMIKYY